MWRFCHGKDKSDQGKFIIGITSKCNIYHLTLWPQEVFFDISIDGESAGRVRIGLFGNVVPRTCENIAQLAARQEVRGLILRVENRKYFFQLSQERVTRSAPSTAWWRTSWCRGATSPRGTAREASPSTAQHSRTRILRWKIFQHRNFLLWCYHSYQLEHSGVGLVSMANSGENTNKSLFFILTCYTQSERWN